MLKKIREMRPQYQSTGYMRGRHAVHRGGQAHAGRGQDLSAANMKAALDGIRTFDTGG